MSRLKTRKQRSQVIRKIIVMVFCGVMLVGSVAFATDTTGVTKGISALSNMFVAILRGIGGFLSIKSAGEAVTAYQQNDNSSMYAAIKGLIGGLCLFFLKEILGLIGVTI